MTKETVEQVFTLSSKIDRAERTVKQFKDIQESLQNNQRAYFSSLSSGIELIANDVDLSPVIDLLVEITGRHLVKSREALAAL